MSADVMKAQSVHRQSSGRPAQLLSGLLIALLTFVLVEVLFEAWVQVLLASRRYDAVGHLVAELPQWPKTLKNGVLLALVVTGLAKIAVQRRWREFRTGADLALLVLGVIMALAGGFGESSPLLIGQAVFVYFRGAIVFYAWRALNPPWRQVRIVLWIVGTIVGVNVVIAIAQMLVGSPAFEVLQWLDLTWAGINRSQALLDHPNHLGHVLGLTLLGMLAWMVVKPRVTVRWWLLFATVGLGLSATQSRESIIAVVVAGFVIWYLRRSRGRAVFLAVTMLVALFGAHLVVRPENIVELANRLRGVTSAFEVPSGTEAQRVNSSQTKVCADNSQDCATATTVVPPREIRILYVQQGGTLLLKRPLLGYGVGQFGGIVAYRHDPLWPLDPRFGPGGFNTYNFSSITVDSFWLHLAVETGVLGLLAYSAWLVMLLLPLLRSTTRPRRGDRSTGEPMQRPQLHPTILWAIASLIFGVLVAFLSPALEDPLFPALLFSIIGIGWVVNQRDGATTEGTATTDPPRS
jgi:hypothetical protein